MQKIIRFFNSTPVVVNRITLQSDRVPGSSIIPARLTGREDSQTHGEAEREREPHPPSGCPFPPGTFPLAWCLPFRQVSRYGTFPVHRGRPVPLFRSGLRPFVVLRLGIRGGITPINYQYILFFTKEGDSDV